MFASDLLYFASYVLYSYTSKLFLLLYVGLAFVDADDGRIVGPDCLPLPPLMAFASPELMNRPPKKRSTPSEEVKLSRNLKKRAKSKVCFLNDYIFLASSS